MEEADVNSSNSGSRPSPSGQTEEGKGGGAGTGSESNRSSRWCYEENDVMPERNPELDLDLEMGNLSPNSENNVRPFNFCF